MRTIRDPSWGVLALEFPGIDSPRRLHVNSLGFAAPKAPESPALTLEEALALVEGGTLVWQPLYQSDEQGNNPQVVGGYLRG